VEHGVANKRRGSAIGLTTECLAVVARPEGSPASGGGAGATGPRRREVRRGERTHLRNAWRAGLQGDSGKVLRVPIGLESGRGHGLGRACPAAAAGARIPAS
jgi:hypothetical protein